LRNGGKLKREINIVKFLPNLILLLSLLLGGQVNGKEISIVVGLNKPPFVIEKNDSGIQLDILRSAFAAMEYQVRFVYVPLGRHLKSLEQLGVDAVGIISQTHPLSAELYLSSPYITYQNVVAALKQSNFDIDSFNQFEGKTLVAFQNASLFLGAQYRSSTLKASLYHELSEQKRQVKMLMRKRADLIVIDKRILAYLYTQLPKEEQLPIETFSLFKPTLYSAAFKKAEHRDIFNQGIEIIKNNGLYQNIFNSYVASQQ
jgi:polar amino acid transport system substrate-binding protein